MRLKRRCVWLALGASFLVVAAAWNMAEARPRTKAAGHGSVAVRTGPDASALQADIIDQFDRMLEADDAVPATDAAGYDVGQVEYQFGEADRGEPIEAASYAAPTSMNGEGMTWDDTLVADGEDAGSEYWSYDEYEGAEFYDDGMPCDDSEDCFGGCSDGKRWWVQADYLVWWSKGNAMPPLITTSPNQTPRDLAGVLALPATQVLYGNDRVNNEARSGGRISMGLWLDDCQRVGLGGTFFSLGDGTDDYGQSSQGLPILARPFRDAVTGLQDSQLVAFSSTADGDIAAGSVTASTKNEVSSADLYMRIEWETYCNGRVDLIGGYRFSRIDEDLIIRDQVISTDTGGLVPVGTTIDGVDSFKMRNEFHGGDVGWIIERNHGRWSFEWMTKVGLGTMRQQATISGESVVTVPGASPFVREGSLLALPSNIGAYEREKFAVVPEARFNVSYRFNPCWKATVGYTFVYWSEVLRSGRQVDYTVNTSQLSGPPLVGPAQPAFDFQDGDFWVQGLNVGLEYSF